MHVTIFDFDGTLVSQDSFRIFGRLAAETWWERLWVDLQTIRLKLTREGNAAYKQRVLRSVWAPKAEEERRAVVAQMCRRMFDLAYPAIVEELTTQSRQNDRTLVVTASPEFYVRPVVDAWGDDIEVHGLKIIEERDGDLKVHGMYGPEKADLVRSLLGPQSGETDVCVYTDHASDLPLLRLADRAFLVDPSDRLIHCVQQAGIPCMIERPAIRA